MHIYSSGKPYVRCIAELGGPEPVHVLRVKANALWDGCVSVHGYVSVFCAAVLDDRVSALF